MSNVLIINGSYRADCVTDRLVDQAAEALRQSGAQAEIVLLREQHIEFCRNCRSCTQDPGEAPGECVLDDDMRSIVDRIEQADAYILASPTNFSSVTALFKRFMERLVVYGHWPWNSAYPRNRKAKAANKRALLISSCAAPGWMGRWSFATRSQLKLTAKTIGANVVGTVFAGLVSKTAKPDLDDRILQRTRVLATRLL